VFRIDVFAFLGHGYQLTVDVQVLVAHLTVIPAVATQRLIRSRFTPSAGLGCWKSRYPPPADRGTTCSPFRQEEVPTSRVSSIDPEGMVNAWMTKNRRTKAMAKAQTMVSSHSRAKPLALTGAADWFGNYRGVRPAERNRIIDHRFVLSHG